MSQESSLEAPHDTVLYGLPVETWKGPGERRCFKGVGIAEYKRRVKGENTGVEKFGREEGEGLGENGRRQMPNQNEDTVESP